MGDALDEICYYYSGGIATDKVGQESSLTSYIDGHTWTDLTWSMSETAERGDKQTGD